MIFIATLSIEQMRAAISVLYQGNWSERVARMSDEQVASIFQKNLDKVRRRMKIRAESKEKN